MNSTKMEKIIVINKVYVHGSVYRESNLITVQQDATYSVYYISVGSSTSTFSITNLEF